MNISYWFKKQIAKAKLNKVFQIAELWVKYSYGKNQKGLLFPKIHSISIDEEKEIIYYVFSLPAGLNPKDIEKKEYCFKQIFGNNIDLKGDNKRFTLTVYTKNIADEMLMKKSALRMGYDGDTMLFWDTKDIDTIMRPTVVIANPGEGKSEMLITKFLDWIKLGYGAAVIDTADGQVVDKILYNIPDEDKDRVVLLNFNDLFNPPGLSDFSEIKGGGREVSQALSQMWMDFYVNYFKIEDHHRSKDFIRKSSVPIFSFEENTILEQYLMIANEEFRKEFIEKKLKNNKRLFKYYVWWDNFNKKPIKVKNEETKAILNKFDMIMDNENLKNIVCQKNPKVPKFRQLIDERKIILIKASEGIFQYSGARILGALLLMKFWMAALSRYDQKLSDRIPFKLFCDEPQNYISSGNYVEEMLAKSRKYRLGLELYFQDPVQIEKKDKNLLKLLIGMNPHLVLGKLSAKVFEKYFEERIKPIAPEEGERLPPYHWIISIYKEKQFMRPIIMRALPMTPDPTPEIIASKKEWILSLKRQYTRPVEEVEEDIQKREFAGYEFQFENNEIKGNSIDI